MTRNHLSAVKDRIEGAVNDRGQVGIGTLIVFIAMVLVAAIAAGVLINTAGFLQTKSEQTGQESSAQVSNRVQVVSAFGNVGNERVKDISLTVMRGSGADDINLSAATIEWIGPEKAKTLVYGDKANATQFTVKTIKDPDKSSPVLNTQDDRLEVNMSASSISSQGLGEGEEVKLKLTTQYGAVTLYRANVPQSLSQESAVTV
ncbi:archaellin/type IV pilin N-terminal domain-containing protein [Halorussus sp. MSC15.2]|uniref:archaellin/type IV pilin N-terminal domain-containing protein n=1 Tax=Halorussus sp. MSC15.2 TaxID=2283638 RepID=UPI0013CF4909|nr:archaellin/type IV pilin N-terminal domain-containing protein [Halorussus sp. MSC15.2]NEU57200.1 flagellin [Halorussus sp. MSC15.2]